MYIKFNNTNHVFIVEKYTSQSRIIKICLQVKNRGINCEQIIQHIDYDNIINMLFILR